MRVLLGVVAMLAAVAAAWAGPEAAAEDELRMAFTSTWSLPWGKLEGTRVSGGIQHDVALAVARRLGWKLRYVLLPASKGDRSELDRHTDLHCGIDPSWTRRPEAYHWSEPLFDTSDLLIGHSDALPVRSLSELPSGSRVGAVGGYRYPTLEARFAAGQLKRDDAPDQARVLEKLTRKRTDYAVVSPQALGWFLRHNPQSLPAEWRVTVQQSAFYCAVPQSSPRDAAQILDAVHALQREGELARILSSYSAR
ncbi:substrate-binding periplasmic protein [Inhella proteolytica]|uniref:ABC transporter substrate-binding protein n=1 Tax=Inhella proteolytica TaxID=2795029 RepID=A0A931NCU6_9BURK|nr:ABC transporter substrate-binding protein [Inhella proteolytica]MBH9575957.1 ABC transporter substrate-binding protein [Inhella proteolytica]